MVRSQEVFRSIDSLGKYTLPKHEYTNSKCEIQHSLANPLASLVSDMFHSTLKLGIIPRGFDFEIRTTHRKGSSYDRVAHVLVEDRVSKVHVSERKVLNKHSYDRFLHIEETDLGTDGINEELDARGILRVRLRYNAIGTDVSQFKSTISNYLSFDLEVGGNTVSPVVREPLIILNSKLRELNVEMRKVE